jgi:hypothetical protein
VAFSCERIVRSRHEKATMQTPLAPERAGLNTPFRGGGVVVVGGWQRCRSRKFKLFLKGCDMKLHTNIYLATSEDTSRYDLRAVQLIPTGKAEAFAAATDGKVLAISKEAEAGIDKPVLVPAEVCRRKAKETNHDVVFDETKKVWTRHSWDRRQKKTALIAPEAEGRFPRAQDVIPAVSGDTHIAVPLDGTLLAKLASAMATNEEKRGITLFIPLPEKGEFVDSPIPAMHISEASIGVIMPFYMPDSSVTDSIAEYNKLREEYVAAANAPDKAASEAAQKAAAAAKGRKSAKSAKSEPAKAEDSADAPAETKQEATASVQDTDQSDALVDELTDAMAASSIPSETSVESTDIANSDAERQSCADADEDSEEVDWVAILTAAA